ncbi:MAG: CBS domain-containing protein [Actinomycetota bacterium]
MTTVRDVMTGDPVAVGPTTNLVEAARVMSTAHVGSVLVMLGASLAGIFTERDIMRALSDSPSADAGRVSHVDRWMTPDPTTIGPEASAGEALDVMLSGGFRHLPVMDPGGVVIGVVSMRDLVQAIAKP